MSSLAELSHCRHHMKFILCVNRIFCVLSHITARSSAHLPLDSQRSAYLSLSLLCARTRRDVDENDDEGSSMCTNCGEEIVVDENGTAQDGAIIPVHCAGSNGRHTLSPACKRKHLMCSWFDVSLHIE